MTATNLFSSDASPSTAVIIDVSPLQGRDNERGIARYIADLIETLSRDTRIRVFARSVPYLPNQSEIDEHRVVVALDQDLRREIRTLNLPTVYVVSSPFFDELRATDVIPRWLSELGIPTIGLIYDVIPALFPEIYLADDLHKRAYLGRLRLIKTCNHYVSISNSAAKDFAAFAGIPGSRITAIGTGADNVRFSKQTARLAVESEIHFLHTLNWPNSKLVLYVAGQDGRKNVAGLIEAWSKVHKRLHNHRLIITCHVPEAVLKRWRALLQTHDVDPRSVSITGRVSDSQLRALYGAADFQVFASLYEGFGLPIAEAALSGLVSISGNNSSLPEVLGSEFCTFNAGNPSDMARAIYELASDEDLLSSLQQLLPQRYRAFSWSSVREKFLDVLRTTASLPDLSSRYTPLHCEIIRHGVVRTSSQTSGASTDSPKLQASDVRVQSVSVHHEAFDRLLSRAFFDTLSGNQLSEASVKYQL